MKKRILTGLQCTADQFHLGNYFAAVKPLIDLGADNSNETFLFLANMHSYNTIQDSNILRHNALNTLKLFFASVSDIDKFFIYNQADIPAHAQLTWVFQCLTNMGSMERMHAFKSKAQDGKENEANIGLFCYPILMAADILLYDAHFVPVGQDQKQHVEYARDVAQKFNHLYGQTFVIPEPLIQKEVAIIPGIDGRKMSKSYNNYIGILDEESMILKKVKQIASGTQTIEEPKDPDTCNIYNILKLFLTTDENVLIRKRYTDGGLSYKEVKDYLFEKVILFTRPIQERFAMITDDEVKQYLKKNAQKANDMALVKIQDVYQKIGFSL